MLVLMLSAKDGEVNKERRARNCSKARVGLVLTPALLLEEAL
jgi:hypothetical protein